MTVQTESSSHDSLEMPPDQGLTAPTRVSADIEKDNDGAVKIVLKVLSEHYVMGIWRIAGKVLHRHDPPDLFPHYTLPGLPYYVYHDSSFWTSGFFPGCIWLLYERSLKQSLSIAREDLLKAAKMWQTEMAKEQFKTDNHDLGFMIMPSFARDYELTGCRESLDVVINAARSLATRFSPTTGVIRSWAGARTKAYDLNQKDIDFVVVIDSLMNLDLLYFAALHTGDKRLAHIATTHAETTLRNHIRPNYSSYHLVNYDARNGSVRHQLTNQGYANESTWARGQAWALYGFATVYKWTRSPKFLEAAIRIADYFISRLDEDAVVYWDFDAPRPGVWDVSAATCTCSGLLLLQSLAPARGEYVHHALRILDTVVHRTTSTGDALFERSTVNDNQHALFRLAEHGCVYADYYFLEAGNRLLELSSVQKACA